jgi:hypothetical protein
MSKKDFIALADAIKAHNKQAALDSTSQVFTTDQLETLADFCKRMNPRFMQDRWFGYIDGENGPNGGSIRK